MTTVIATALLPAQVQAFLEDAATYVTARLEPLAVLSTETLKAVEKYLACHFVTLRDPRIVQAQFGDTNERFQRDNHVSEYLKTAATLDSTGTIRADFIDVATRGVKWRVGEGY